MNPDLFPILNANAATKAVLGASPLRVYPWGRAPQNVVKPYAVYSVYNANPENYLDTVPDIDNKGTQINIYAATADSLKSAYTVVRNALEPYAHMTSFATPDLDADTDLYSCRMEFDFWDGR
jgi:hypothetical protein